MSMRLRFVLACLFFSIAPLGALTWHAYASGARTFDEATAREKDLLTRDITRRQRLAMAAVDAAFDGEQDEQPGDPAVDLTESLAQVFVTVPGRPGDIPFAIDSLGNVHARTDEDRRRIAGLGVLSAADLEPPVAQRSGWIVATAAGPAAESGLRLGAARPLSRAVSELESDAARIGGLGLLLIGTALVGMVPLFSRFMRQSRRFTESARHMTRLQRELDHGQRIQRDLLPRAPLRHPSIHVAATSAPAREVGGDFFDYMALPDGRIALVIGDVSGKGVGAALYMAHLQASLRTRLSLGQDAAALVADLDAGGAPASTYATLVIAVFDPDTRLLRYVNAGHPPPCIRRARGRLEHLESSGLPIGLLPGHPYETCELMLDPEDVVLFYTDGCTDAEDASGTPIGVAALERMLAESTSRDETAVLAEIRDHIAGVRDTREAADDMTLMLARIR